ncbi:ribonuclease H-like domain-containing protein [Tanacetum coccineum]
MTHPHPKMNFVPTAVATKSRLVPVNAAKQSSPRAVASISTARHVNTVASKPIVNVASPTKYSYFKVHSPLRRPFNQKSAVKTNNFNEKVYTAKLNNVTTARPEVVVSTVEGKKGKYYIDGGFVAFAGSPKGGKITGKGKIRTGKLDFEDVYFVKELKFNLFSVSQMCDKKNSVLFTETECLVLSPDFKLLDESQVLLKVPRQNNMYSFDLKNIVPSGGLTCLFAKATIDESNLWHRRLGHINFKTMNKLVRGNLFCGMKRIKREFSVARTPQQNGVAERKNRTLIEAARTMLADSLLPTPLGRSNPLGKFDRKADEGFFVGYSINSKAFRGVDQIGSLILITNKLLNYGGYSSKDEVADDAGKKTNKEPANEGERNGQEKEGGASNKE